MKSILPIRIFNYSLAAAALLFLASCMHKEPEAVNKPYLNMPAIPAIGDRTEHYFPVSDSASGPAIDPAKGYRLQDLGKGLYMITDNGYQSMFLVHDSGVIVVDAPPPFAQHILKGIAEVTDKPITHVVYSHMHDDHIGGMPKLNLGKDAIIIAHDETKRLLVRANDPNRPIPTVTFADKYRLTAGNQVLELSYHNLAHEAGNIFIYAPAQRTLMVVDVIFPGWMPWRRFALAKDIPGYYAQVEEISNMDWDVLVGGHVARTGTHQDVATQLEFMKDLKTVTRAALQNTKPTEEMNGNDLSNAWAVFDNYIDRVVIKSVNELTPKWKSKLAGFDVFIWDQAYAMEQSLRIEEH